MLKRAAALLLVCASLGLGISCSNSSNSRYLYGALPSGGAGEIVEYREDPNSGALTQLVSSPITAGAAVEALAIHPSKKFLYAANSGSGNVSLFTIASTGDLNEVTPRATAGTAPTLLAMDPSGAFLYVANSGSFDLTIYKIDPSTGVLTTFIGSYPIGMSALNMVLSPSGNFLYLTGAGTPGVIEAFSLNSGQPTIVQGTPFLTGTDPTGLAIDPGGKFLYTANRAPDNSISEFTINGDGSIAQLANSPVGESFSSPTALLVDKSGKYLYVANQGSSNLAGYSIGSDGSITLLSASPFGTSSQPSFIAMDPSGNFLFVGSQSGVQSFSLASSSGTLTSVSTYSGSAPTSIVLTP